MGTIYIDNEGNPCPQVIVSVTRQYWTAKSDSPQCEEYVNSILPKTPYNGISDEELIFELMLRNGFGKAVHQSDPNRDPAPSKAMIFDHVETAAAMRVQS